MSEWNAGKVAAKRKWTERLFSLSVDADIAPFTAGQFTKLALEIGGEIVARPYSLVNPPDVRPLEFCFSMVPDGPLSPHLAALDAGEPILVAPRANGFLVIEEIPQAQHLWLISTGTGVGPFLSILRTALPWRRFERIVLVQAVRQVADLLYTDTTQALVSEHPTQFVHIPFVSREAFPTALVGRVPQALADGRLESRAGVSINAADSQFMLCGNPQMVDDVTKALIARGLKKHRRRDPGQISVENYW